MDTALENNMNPELKEKILKAHPYKIWYDDNDKRWKTHIVDKSKKGGRKLIAKKAEDDLLLVLAEASLMNLYLEQLSLEEMYFHWKKMRKEDGIKNKTLLENQNEWKRFISNTALANKPLHLITVQDIDNLFIDITRDKIVSSKRFTNLKSVLNGVFSYAVKKNIIHSNPVAQIKTKDYSNRFAPAKPKAIYTMAERQLILNALEYDTDVYALAIRFAFYGVFRVSELAALKKSDIHGDTIHLLRSVRKTPELNDNCEYQGRKYCIENSMKGYQQEGFRILPLSQGAKKIVSQIDELYPENIFLFENNNAPILGDSFNKKLKSVCDKLKIPYRSSHVIRFTMATEFIKAGLSVPELSTLLGHKDTKTTYHYIRQTELSNASNSMITNHLNKLDL